MEIKFKLCIPTTLMVDGENVGSEKLAIKLHVTVFCLHEIRAFF